MARIKRIAKDAQNIEVQGWIDEERLSNLIGRCISTIYIPRDEDYGISPVESMAAGKPVIGVREGGVLETVVHGETGPVGQVESRRGGYCSGSSRDGLSHGH